MTVIRDIDFGVYMSFSVDTILKEYSEKIDANEQRISSTLKELEQSKRVLDFYESNKALLGRKIKAESEINHIQDKINKLQGKKKRLRKRLVGINKEYKSKWLREVIRKVQKKK